MALDFFFFNYKGDWMRIRISISNRKQCVSSKTTCDYRGDFFGLVQVVPHHTHGMKSPAVCRDTMGKWVWCSKSLLREIFFQLQNWYIFSWLVWKNFTDIDDPRRYQVSLWERDFSGPRTHCAPWIIMGKGFMKSMTFGCILKHFQKVAVN